MVKVALAWVLAAGMILGASSVASAKRANSPCDYPKLEKVKKSKVLAHLLTFQAFLGTVEAAARPPDTDPEGQVRYDTIQKLKEVTGCLVSTAKSCKLTVMPANANYCGWASKKKAGETCSGGCVALKLKKACQTFHDFVTPSPALHSAISILFHEGVHSTQPGLGPTVAGCSRAKGSFGEALHEMEAIILHLNAVCLIEEYLDEEEASTPERVKDRDAAIKHACDYGDSNLETMDRAVTAAGEDCPPADVEKMVDKYDSTYTAFLEAKARAKGWN